MQTSAFKFQTKDEKSYSTLAAFAATLSVPVTLYPEQKTIVIASDAAKMANDFIDSEGLDFYSVIFEFSDGDIDDLLADPTTDPAELRILAQSLRDEQKAWEEDMKEITDERNEINGKLEKAERDRDLFYDWYKEHKDKYTNLYDRVNAISVLLGSVCH